MVMGVEEAGAEVLSTHRSALCWACLCKHVRGLNPRLFQTASTALEGVGRGVRAKREEAPCIAVAHPSRAPTHTWTWGWRSSCQGIPRALGFACMPRIV